MNCKRCGRKISSATSVARQMGAHCARMDRIERALAEYKAEQVAKAMELIEDGAILPSLKRKLFFTAVSADGTSTYLVHPKACTCPAGLKSRACYHRIAAIALAA